MQRKKQTKKEKENIKKEAVVMKHRKVKAAMRKETN